MNAALPAAVSARTTLVPEETGAGKGATVATGPAPGNASVRQATAVSSSPFDVLLGATAPALGTGWSGTSTGSWALSPTAAGLSGILGFAPTPSPAPARGGSATAAAAAPATSGKGWAFLSDASLSIEDKLAMFMQTVQEKTDDELQKKMDDYRARYAEAQAAQEDSGGWFADFLKVVIPPLGIADALGVDVDAFLGDALKALGGPLLAALATALGAPWLAPVALKLGDALAKELSGSSSSKKKSTSSASGAAGQGGSSTTASSSSGTAKSTTSSASTKSSSGKSSSSTDVREALKDVIDKIGLKYPTQTKAEKAATDSPDERLAMLEIQRMVEKQNQTFTLVSNILKSLHDTAMVPIQNIR